METCQSCYGDGHCRHCTGSGEESAGRDCQNCGGSGSCPECGGVRERATAEQLARTCFQAPFKKEWGEEPVSS